MEKMEYVFSYVFFDVDKVHDLPDVPDTPAPCLQIYSF